MMNEVVDAVISEISPYLGGTRLTYHIYGPERLYKLRVLYDQPHDMTPLLEFATGVWDEPIPDNYSPFRLTNPSHGKVRERGALAGYFLDGVRPGRFKTVDIIGAPEGGEMFSTLIQVFPM